jgi:apolipoprotein D and lipocalin family protein
MASSEAKTATKSGNDMTVVRGLDIPRYMGRWYEIASFPNFFQPRDGRNTRATYALQEDGATVHVLNETWSKGKRDYIEGTAYKADPNSDEAKLKVKFYLPPFLPIIPVVGDYWVLYVDEEYQYALVGEPRRKSLWVSCFKLFRSPLFWEQTFRLASLRVRVCVCLLTFGYTCPWIYVCRFCAGRRASTRRCTTSCWRRPRRKATT